MLICDEKEMLEWIFDESQLKEKTKKVRVNLSAITRMMHSIVIDIPESATPAQYNKLIEGYYDLSDGEDFTPDCDFWEKGDCYIEEVNSKEK